MEKNYTLLSLALLFFCIGSSAYGQAQTIAQWTFETSQPATSGPVTPEAGSGSATGGHADATASYSSPGGNGSEHCYSSSKWAVNDYWQFEVSTTNFKGIEVSYDQISSGTGPGSFQLQASTDGTTFTNIGAAYSVLENASPDNWKTTGTPRTTSHYTVSLPSAYDNSAAVYIRMVDISTTSANGGTVNGRGTSRIDNVTVAAASTVPVTLDDFSVTKSAAGALLKWTTKTEINSHHYDILKSIDGKAFTVLGTIASRNSSMGASYNFTDQTYTSGTAYYQLRMVDADGNTKLSNTVTIGIGSGNNDYVSLVNTLAHDNINLNITNPVGAFTAKIVSASGKIIITKVLSGNNSTAQISIAGLQSGVYLLQLSGKGLNKTFRFIKQ